MSSPRGRSLSASCSARGCRRLGCSRSGLDQRVGGCWPWGRGGRRLQVAGSGAGSVSIRGLAMPRHHRSFTYRHRFQGHGFCQGLVPTSKDGFAGSGRGVGFTSLPSQSDCYSRSGRRLGTVRPPQRQSPFAWCGRTTTWAWSDCSCCFACDNCGSIRLFAEPSPLCPGHTCYEYQLLQQAAEKILASQPGVAQLGEAWS